ncbi:hypothetical protein [Variovorax atrisoli]|uniref:hypothetical protein n=1 Tax=Variovorax atrisoli TaxID=3394203 RepID=UPI000378F7E4|nr:hypothetical protein [Variovorax paradoxus]
MSTANKPNIIFMTGAANPFPDSGDRRFFLLPGKFDDAALDAGVAAWFGVTKVEAEKNFIRSRMGAAVLAVFDNMPSTKTNYQRVAAMNTAFGNPRGNAASIDQDRVRKQCLNIADELGELYIALGADETAIKAAVENLKWNAAKACGDISHDQARDALCDIHVFAYGAHHLMGIDADRDMNDVVDGVMTRFIKDDADKAATIAKHATSGVTDVYFEGEYPTMVMKSGSDQPDAPKGKFLKSASYREPVFAPLPAQEGGAA